MKLTKKYIDTAHQVNILLWPIYKNTHFINHFNVCAVAVGLRTRKVQSQPIQ